MGFSMCRDVLELNALTYQRNLSYLYILWYTIQSKLFDVSKLWLVNVLADYFHKVAGMDRTTDNFILISFHLEQICKFRILPFVISRYTSDSCIFQIRNFQQFLPIHWNVAPKDILKIASTSVILPSLSPSILKM